MITGNDPNTSECSRPNFNEWGNPLFRPSDDDDRVSETICSMSYRPTSVPFRSIEDIVSRLGKVNAVKVSHVASARGNPLFRVTDGCDEAAQQGTCPHLSSSGSPIRSPPQLPAERAATPASARELASTCPSWATDAAPAWTPAPLRDSPLDSFHEPRRGRFPPEFPPLTPEASGPVDPPVRQRLTFRQGIHALAVGTANSLRRSTRNYPQPNHSLSLEDAVHVTCFNRSSAVSRKPVIPIPVVTRRRPQKRLWRRCHTWRQQTEMVEPVRSSSMGAIASPSSLCFDDGLRTDLSSLTNCASQSHQQAPSPDNAMLPEIFSTAPEHQTDPPCSEDTKSSLAPHSARSRSTLQADNSPAPTAATLPSDAAAGHSPEQGMLPPPPVIHPSPRLRCTCALDSCGSHSRDIQLLQVASGPPHSAGLEAAQPAPLTSGTKELSTRDSMSEGLPPPTSDSNELGPTATLQMYGTEESAELPAGGSSRLACASAPAAPRTHQSESPGGSLPLGDSPARSVFSMARRPSPAALRRARLANEFHSPLRQGSEGRRGGYGRHPSAPLSPARSGLGTPGSGDVPPVRRAASQDTWMRVHARGFWHGQTLATLNSLASEWQTIKRSLNSTRTSPHVSASPSRQTAAPEALCMSSEAAPGAVGSRGATPAESAKGKVRSHSLSAGSRPPHPPTASLQRMSAALRALHRTARLAARANPASAKAIDPKTTPFSPTEPLPTEVQERKPAAGPSGPVRNSARMHAHRLAAIRAQLRHSPRHDQSLPTIGVHGHVSQRSSASSARVSGDDGDIRSANTAARRIGRDPRPRDGHASSTTTPACVPGQAAKAAVRPAGAMAKAGATGAPQTSPPQKERGVPSLGPEQLQPSTVPPSPWQTAMRSRLGSEAASSLAQAGQPGSLTQLCDGASELGLLAHQDTAQRSCSPKVAGGPPVRRTGQYSHGSGPRGAGPGRHNGTRSVPARVSAVWR